MSNQSCVPRIFLVLINTKTNKQNTEGIEEQDERKI